MMKGAAMLEGLEYEIDDDVPNGFDPDDLDADMFEDFPCADPAKEEIE